jgi:L-histidine N-alpha-methyltransferase
VQRPTTSERFRLLAAGPGADRAAFARDVARGLSDRPKHLLCRYLYDHEGSHLFDAITALPEYYLPRAEREALEAGASEIASRCPAGTVLIELGSGSAIKTRILIDALLRRQHTLQYVPVDVSRTALVESAQSLLRDYPALHVTAVGCEYQEALAQLDGEVSGPKLILWLGSNIGNFHRVDASRFLRQLRATTAPGDLLLVSIDLRKDRAILERAYDDAQGVTARFNRNLLARVNRELGGHFQVEAFQHCSIYNEEAGRIEMYLVSSRAQRVRIDDLGLDVSFAEGEAIHTEDSYKYSRSEIEMLAREAGLVIQRQWLDADQRMSVNLLGH